MTRIEPAFQAVADLVGRRAGLAFEPPRRADAELGIRRAMARAGIGDPARYRARIGRDEALLDDLIGELTVGETYFFREPAQFRFLRAEVLPEIRRRRGAGHLLRAWSAGCATGEEAYSLAMTFAAAGLGNSARVLATDISRAALAGARRASYGAWSLRGEAAELARPFLRRDGGRFVVVESI